MIRPLERNKGRRPPGGLNTGRAALLDAMLAAFEIEFCCCEAVGVACSEPADFMLHAFDALARQKGDSIFSFPALPFKSSTVAEGIAQAHGFCREGHRSSFFSTEPLDWSEFVRRDSGRPVLHHHFSPAIATLPARTGPIQLSAMNPQQAADLTLIGHSLAEQLCAPGIISHLYNAAGAIFERVSLPEPSFIGGWLGLPHARIPSPGTAQRNAFGRERRRIPARPVPDLRVPDAEFEDLCFAICEQEMLRFGRASGRDYKLIEEVGIAESEVIIIANGNAFEALLKMRAALQKRVGCAVGLIRPVLLNPFPAHIIAQAIFNKKAVIALAESDAESALTTLLLMREKTHANRASNDSNGAGKPWPTFPNSDREQEFPRLLAAQVGCAGIALKEIVKGIKHVVEADSPQLLMDFDVDAEAEGANATLAAAPVQIDFGSDFLFPQRLTEIVKLHFKAPVNLRMQAEMRCASLRFDGKSAFALTDKTFFLLPGRGRTISPQSCAALPAESTIIVDEEPAHFESWWWRQAPDSRELIREKKCAIYAICADSTADDAGSLMFAGALLHLITCRTPGAGRDVAFEHVLKSMKAGGHVALAEAVSLGASDLHRIDLRDLEHLADPAAETPAHTLQNEAIPEHPIEEMENLKRARAFFYDVGRGPGSKGETALRQLLPVHIFPFIGDGVLQTDYPLCLTDDDRLAVPIHDLFAALKENVTGTGDESGRLSHALRQLESAMLRAHNQRSILSFRELWTDCLAQLAASHKNDFVDLNTVLERTPLVKRMIDADAALIPFQVNGPRQLIGHVFRQLHAAKMQGWFTRIEQAHIRLSEILQTERNKESGALSPDILRAGFGDAFNNDVDFSTFSNIAQQATRNSHPDKARIARIVSTIDTLEEGRQFFAALDFEIESEDCRMAQGVMLAFLRMITAISRALQISDLEIEGSYVARKHDSHFSSFTFSSIDPESLRSLPPLLLNIINAPLDDPNQLALLRLLASELPVKICLMTTAATPASVTQPEVFIGESWDTKLARLVASLENTFVLQACFSNSLSLVAGVKDGLKHDGPALFSVMCTDVADTPRENYLRTAAALESRAFPHFVHNPSEGAAMNALCSIEGNPSKEKIWPENVVRISTEKGAEVEVELSFTYADFLAMDQECAHFFLPLSRAQWFEKMCPVADYIAAGEAEAEQIPYILMATSEGIVKRVIVAEVVINEVKKVVARWKALQEAGGIHNSFAEQVVAAEREKHAREKELELAELEQRYQDKMELAIGKVADEIVSNIAAGLLDQQAAASTRPPISAQTVSAPAAAEGETGQPEADEIALESQNTEDDEEPIILADPFIDTALCTSCNECTQRNSAMFVYDGNRQAIIKDADAGSFRDLVEAAEACPAKIIHPGKPKNPDEPNLDELIKRAEPFQ